MAVIKILLIAASLLCLNTQTLAQNKTSPVLSLYCEDDKPLQFYDENKKLTGLTVEVVQEIQRRLGNKDRIQVVPWSRGIDKLNKEPNSFLFTMARTPDREQLYQWIGPILFIEYGLYVKADSSIQINKLEDAKKIGLIGVYRDDIRDQTLSKLGFTNLDRASSVASSFKKLMIGRIAAYADAKKGVAITANLAGYQASDVKLAYDLFKNPLYIAVSKNTDAAIVAQWNSSLEEMKKDKSFLKILKKYNEQ
ncbi:substrate-binding periplasmic protein [Undibacterium flavidum]|uniref:Transporter substrate-binding domain-containing protein n=1 Tax=Undibacterium flavidum TaxID=2762297 RepID=A0ABR6YHB5_9BURK|nr:transporter substrate-binding domain-containing protein [Undibacterium flavidum]MBC3875902.1 transporter substrate-binding domain-containing protein [Undibacterium flavidum]